MRKDLPPRPPLGPAPSRGSSASNTAQAPIHHTPTGESSEAAHTPDRVPPADFRSAVEGIKTDFARHPDTAPDLLVARFRTLVPGIETQQHMDLCVQVLDEFACLPGIEKFEQSLKAVAKKKQLLGPDLVPINAHYARAVSLDELAGLSTDRWSLNWSGAIQKFLEPYRNWLTSDAGRDQSTHVPTGLQQSLSELLPAMWKQPVDAKQLQEFLDDLSWLPPDNPITETLIAATVERSLCLIEEMALSRAHHEERDVQGLQAAQAQRTPLVLKLLCLPANRQATPFKGVEAEVRQLKAAYDAAISHQASELPPSGPSDGATPQLAQAASVFLDGALGLLPHIASPGDLITLQTKTNYRRKETDPRAFNQRLFLQKLRWVLGMPDPTRGQQPLSDDVLVRNILRLLLVAPLAPTVLNAWGLSAQSWSELKKAIDEDQLPAAFIDQGLSPQTLDDQVRKALVHIQDASPVSALVQSLLAAMRRLPSDGQGRVCDQVRRPLGATTTQRTVVQAEPPTTAHSADLAPPVPHPSAEARPAPVEAFPARLTAAQNAFQQSRKGLHSGQIFVHSLSAAIHTISLPEHVDALYSATAQFMWDLQSHNERKKQALEDQLRDALLHRIKDVRKQKGLEPDPSVVDELPFARALSTLRALL